MKKAFIVFEDKHPISENVSKNMPSGNLILGRFKSKMW
jgi:hypothetical protein